VLLMEAKTVVQYGNLVCSYPGGVMSLPPLKLEAVSFFFFFRAS
jgi:hypothetical protein